MRVATVLLACLLGCVRSGFESPPGGSAGDAAAITPASDAGAADASVTDTAPEDGGALSGVPVIVDTVHLGSADVEHATAVAVDAVGNVFLGGSFGGTFDFGDGDRTASGSSDYFLTSLSPQLQHRWTVTYGGGGTEGAHDLEPAPGGDVYWIGELQGSDDLGTGQLTSAGGDDWLFGRRDGQTGELLWLSYAFSPSDNDIGGRISEAPDGRLFISGSFAGTMDIDGDQVTAAGSHDAFMAELDPAGGVLTTVTVGGADHDLSGGVAATADGPYLAGRFSGTVTAGGESSTSAGGYDAFVAAYDTALSLRWLRTFGSTGSDAVKETAGFSDGGVLVCGWFHDTLDLGVTNVTSAGLDDAFALRLDADGDVVWLWTAGGAGSDGARACTTDALGRACIFGNFEQTVDFGDAVRVSSGLQDLFVVCLDAGGATRWSLSFGGTDVDAAEDIYSDRPGSVWVAGIIRETVDLGGTQLTSAGDADGLLLHIEEH